MKKSIRRTAGFLVFAAAMGFACSVQAQEIRTNEKGEKIIVYPDGTWQYFTVFGGSKEVLFDSKDAHTGDTEPEFGAKYPVFKAEIAPMDLAFAIPEEYARRIAIRKSQIATEARTIAQKRAYDAQQQRKKLEAELARMQQQNASWRSKEWTPI